MDFKGRAKRITDYDLPRIGYEIGVGEDEIHAVLDVESSGSGFDSKGRPKMLFEPHIFDRLLPEPQKVEARNLGLAYPKWGTKPYPKDSYPKLIEAMKINRSIALKSASWGLGQIMGFNHAAAGFATVEDMVTAFMDSEADQLEAMIQFIKTNGLDDELRRHDWAGFARGYNGSGFAKHNYHGRLAARYAYWKGKPDTRFNPADAETEEKVKGSVPIPAPPPRPQPQPAKPTVIGFLIYLFHAIVAAFSRKDR